MSKETMSYQYGFHDGRFNRTVFSSKDEDIDKIGQIDSTEYLRGYNNGVLIRKQKKLTELLTGE